MLNEKEKLILIRLLEEKKQQYTTAKDKKTDEEIDVLRKVVEILAIGN